MTSLYEIYLHTYLNETKSTPDVDHLRYLNPEMNTPLTERALYAIGLAKYH